MCAGFNKVSFSYYVTVRLSDMSERHTWYWIDTMSFIKKHPLIYPSVLFSQIVEASWAGSQNIISLDILSCFRVENNIFV